MLAFYVSSIEIMGSITRGLVVKLVTIK